MTAVLEPVAPEPPSVPGKSLGRRGTVRPSGKSRLGRTSGVGLGVVTLWMTILVLLPLAVVVGKAFSNGWGSFSSTITDSETASAIELTVGLAFLAAVINGVMGTLVAWVLVRERFRGSGLLEKVIDIPFALPTIVAGLVMLALYGSDSPVHVTLVQTRPVLVVALLFVTLPFTVRTVQPVLLDLDRDAEQAAASLGASGAVIFRRIILPQILPAAASGVALSFARALGEFASLTLISGNLTHYTEIAPYVIFSKLQDVDPRATQQAAAIATVLLLASAMVLVLIDVVQRRVARRG